MELLDFIEVRGGKKRIELYKGDLTALSATEGFDLLVVSAFPDDYTPTPTSLIGALWRRGLSVDMLAMVKELDLRADFSCWLSRRIASELPGLRFQRILCFEPSMRGRPPERVGDIFRALTPILAEKPDIKSVALPMVAAGDQGCAVEEIVGPLLDAAVHWLETGLPLDRIMIVAYTDAEAKKASPLFAKRKAEVLPPSPPLESAPFDYDLFISYSRANAAESDALVQALRRSRPSVKIFMDRTELDVGSAWQPAIFESLDNCCKVVALLSPDYLGSKVCKEEFNIAWIRSRETGEDILLPIYLYTAGLPTYMKYRNYLDCREGDRVKISAAAGTLLATLEKRNAVARR
jgi:hypothetical protein